MLKGDSFLNNHMETFEYVDGYLDMSKMDIWTWVE